MLYPRREKHHEILSTPNNKTIWRVKQTEECTLPTLQLFPPCSTIYRWFSQKKTSFIDRCHVWFPEGTPGWRPKKIKKSRVPGFSPGLRESVCWFYRCFFPLKPAWQLVIQILGLVVKPPHRNVWFLESKKKWWPPERSIYYVWYNWSARSIQLRILMWCILLFFTSGPSEENPQFDFHHL